MSNLCSEKELVIKNNDLSQNGRGTRPNAWLLAHSLRPITSSGDARVPKRLVEPETRRDGKTGDEFLKKKRRGGGRGGV